MDLETRRLLLPVLVMGAAILGSALWLLRARFVEEAVRSEAVPEAAAATALNPVAPALLAGESTEPRRTPASEVRSSETSRAPSSVVASTHSPVALVTGRVVPPGELAIDRPWDMVVFWNPAEEEGRMRSEVARERRTLPARDGSYTLADIPAGVDVVLHAENPFGPGWSERARLEPGEARELWIYLERSPTVAGRVVDEEGRPVAGVFLEVDGESATDSSGDPYARSRSDGTFDVQAPSKIVRIATSDHRLARDAEATVDLRNGSIEDVLLSVVRGGSIAGTLVWPDRSPAEDFEVSAFGPGGYHREEGTNGRFEVQGLLPGSYDIEFQARREAGVGSARVAAIDPGVRNLEVILEETAGFELLGSVTDPEGAPVQSFRVYASRPPAASEANPRSESAEGRAGRFVLQGLDPGEWSFYVDADGHQAVRESVMIEGPSEVAFVLPVAGRVRGIVLDPKGNPVSGAWVGEEERAFTTLSFGFGRDVTDVAGRFALEADAHSMRVVALAREHAASATAVVDCPPGQDVEGIVLRLREPGRIEGHVLDEQGNPVTDVRVLAGPGPAGLWQDSTDAQGAFALELIPAGEFRVSTWTNDWSGAVPNSRVVLLAGETRTIELRFEPADPVQLHARFTRGGRPLACPVSFRSRSFAADGESDADGRLELVLQRPGPWSGVAWVGRDGDDPFDVGQNDLRRFEVTIPDADEHSFELDLDTLPRVRSREELER